MTDDSSIDGPVDGPSMDRRAALVSLAAVLAAAGCSNDVTKAPSRPTTARPSTAGPTPAAATASSTTGGAQGVTTNTPSIEPNIAKTSGPDIVNGPRSRGEVALTFHGAGDISLTEQILRDCAEHDARITIFAVGQWLSGTPSVGRQILAAGHELGNHTWSHQQMPGLSARVADDEIRRGADALRKATGSVGWWFRPSGTPHSTPTIRAAASLSGYRRCVSYDVDPKDYLDPGSDLVVSRTLGQVRPGSIVSLHLGHIGTVQALSKILAGLSAKGLAPVTLSRLLRD
ncbi:MAG: polysaccharide deacetylase family protein [Actinomycetota bacterium]